MAVEVGKHEDQAGRIQIFELKVNFNRRRACRA